MKSAHWEIGKRRDTSMMPCKVIGGGFEQLDKKDESAVKKVMANNRLLRWNSCDMKKTTFALNLLGADDPEAVKNLHTSALADVQAKLINETHKETVWIAETCSCWAIVACSWIMNWGADSRIASNIPHKVSCFIIPSIFSLHSSSNFPCHNLLKFLKHKINALNRITASANGFQPKTISVTKSVGVCGLLFVTCSASELLK